MSDDRKDDFILDELKSIKDLVDECNKNTNEVSKSLAEYKVAFDLHTKQDELMYEEFKRMNDILQQNTDSLREHMLRTSLLEDVVVKIDSRLQPIEIEKIEKEAVKKATKNFILLAAKVAGGLSALAAFIAAVSHYIH
jgi:L-serine deaminase